MVWDQTRAKQLMNELQGMIGEGGGNTPGRWGRRPKQPPPQPRLKARPICTGRGVELYLWVLQFSSLQKKPRREVGTPPPRKPPTQKQPCDNRSRRPPKNPSKKLWMLPWKRCSFSRIGSFGDLCCIEMAKEFLAMFLCFANGKLLQCPFHS